MIHIAAHVLLAGAALGLLLVAFQHLALRRHLRTAPPAPSGSPGISVLKPLCGVDDGLEENLACFAALDWRDYEVLLGVRDTADAAWPVALAAARRWPGRFRVLLQRGEPGWNPKVNQLVTLAREARHDILVVSDSNVRVAPGYLAEIAAYLELPEVGLVTHLIAGVGEQRLGSLFENLHLAGSIGPGVAAAKRILGRDLVVGKSMAMRRRDLAELGGFESAKDVLAEDYLIGVRISRELGKRVALASTPIENVSQGRRVGDFTARYRRWAVMQRQIAGGPAYLAMALLNPVPLALLACLVEPGTIAVGAAAVLAAAKALLDGASARALRPGGFAWRQLLLSLLKDLCFAWAFARGLFEDEVVWRGNRLRVLAGSALEPAEAAEAAPARGGLAA
ncbi:MAG TPA: glycosyltransferase [Anaeromyxobacteraceae bacterium]|nr:glycosyltransferase [Anaeromyxobacteraceae bacterium]